MSSSAKNVMQLELLYIAGGSVSWKLHEHMNTFWLAIPILDIYLIEMHPYDTKSHIWECP